MAETISLKDLKAFAKKRKAEVDSQMLMFSEHNHEVVLEVLHAAIAELSPFVPVVTIYKGEIGWKVNQTRLSADKFFTIGIHADHFRYFIRQIPEIEEVQSDGLVSIRFKDVVK